MGTQSLWQRVTAAVRKTTVEPFLFLIMFGLNVRLVTLQNLFHDRACRVSYGYPDDFCDTIEKESDDPRRLASITYGNNMNNLYIMISTIPALVIATFVGPWSDKYTRKYPLIIACSGILMESIIQTIAASFQNASPLWFLLGPVFSGLSGGFLIVMSITYSYMSDITDERSRQTRFAVLEFFTIMATPIGSLVGGQIYAKFKSVAVMAAGPCSFAAALLWVTLYVVETKPKRMDITKMQMMRDLFRFDRMKESFRTCIQPRPGNLRLQIWLLVFVSFTLRLINLGALTVGFPYTKTAFAWDVERYSYTTTLFSLVNAFSTVTIVPILNKRLMVHEAAVGLIGILSLMAKMIIMSVTVKEWIIFYSWFSGCLYACGGIAVRSRLSKLVPKHELGKVFSLVATCESLSPVLGTVIMTQIFNASAKFYAGLTYAVAGVLLVPSAIIFGWMMKMPTMSFIQYQEEDQAKQMKELESVSKNVF